MSKEKEWTLMFYFAGDNALAPVIVSQLKEIKDAGFHGNIDVLVHFDANALGVPTRIYDVNRARKRNPRLPKTIIGDGRDTFVRDMKEDEVMPDTIIASSGPASAAIKRALKEPDAIKADEALKNFLGFCRENHRARHYMLFLVGHGMIVGNDAFLSDENPISAITLKNLGKILGDFAANVKKDRGGFELLTLHSCSMSAIEVAYQLKGTANFMMGSEGSSFVGTWPYRQLLKEIFNNLKKAETSARTKAKKKNGGQGETRSNPSIHIRWLVEKLYFLTLFNSIDFLLAGYSQDLALCVLTSETIDGVTASIKELAAKLKRGMEASRGNAGSAATKRGKRIKELVLLAHWEAQSYWGESYTDLFDFCRCLRERCDPKDNLEDLRDACLNLMEKLDTIVICSENFGATTQYSHGLSIYFPWSRPNETVTTGNKKARKRGTERSTDEEKGILERYKGYAFTKELGVKSWLGFLESYFDQTKRQSRTEEDRQGVSPRKEELATRENSLRPFGVLSDGKPSPLLGSEPGKPSPVLGSEPGKPSPVLGSEPGKPSPLLGVGEGKPSPLVGAACGCPSIKNYPEERET